MTKFQNTTFAVSLSFFFIPANYSAQTTYTKKDKSYGGSRSDNATSIKKVENNFSGVSQQWNTEKIPECNKLIIK